MGFDPLTLSLASLAIGTASTVASYAGQQQQASAQEAYQAAQAAETTRINELNNQAAVREYVEQSAAERIKQMQQQESAAMETQKIAQESARKQGTMLASTNAAGGALASLMADYERAAMQQKELVRKQYQYGVTESAINLNAYRDRALGRINSQSSYIAAPVSQPSGLGLALGIGSSALGAADKYYRYKDK